MVNGPEFLLDSKWTESTPTDFLSSFRPRSFCPDVATKHIDLTSFCRSRRL